jgi:hypothetical protein
MANHIKRLYLLEYYNLKTNQFSRTNRFEGSLLKKLMISFCIKLKDTPVADE